MDKISVIMPAYNSEKKIAMSINSVLTQSHKNLELLIINDGSIDKTEEVILKCKNKDARISYYSIENSGSAVARNVGLKNATGKYVAFIDSDDCIEKNFLELLYSHAIKYNCDIVSCSFEHIFKDKTISERTYLEAGYYDKKS